MTPNFFLSEKNSLDLADCDITPFSINCNLFKKLRILLRNHKRIVFRRILYGDNPKSTDTIFSKNGFAVLSAVIKAYGGYSALVPTTYTSAHTTP